MPYHHERYDGVTDVKKLLKTAMGWGHQAMAITDHGVVQAFPDANHCVEGKDFKVIYGMEGYLVDDIKNIVTDSRGQSWILRLSFLILRQRDSVR